MWHSRRAADGEKVYDAKNESAFDYACLSEKGWARAYNLRSVFGPRPQPPFRTPDTLFSGNYANTIDCVRPAGPWWFVVDGCGEPPVLRDADTQFGSSLP